MLRAIIFKMLPSLRDRIEAESRAWMVQCPSCEGEVSVWETGGIRFKAAGTTRRLGQCTVCGERALLRIYRPAR